MGRGTGLGHKKWRLERWMLAIPEDCLQCGAQPQIKVTSRKTVNNDKQEVRELLWGCG